MAAKILPPQAYLRECFDYDPDTGVLRWKGRPREHFPTERGWKVFNARFVNAVAGEPRPSLGIIVNVNGKFYLAHRLIWKFVTGEDPPEEVDHRNLNCLENQWTNLRLATHAENMRNRRGQSGEVGLKGVRRATGSRSFVARISYQGRLIHLGCFPTPEAAHAAYCEAAKRLHGEFWNAG